MRLNFIRLRSYPTSNINTSIKARNAGKMKKKKKTTRSYLSSNGHLTRLPRRYCERFCFLGNTIVIYVLMFIGGFVVWGLRCVVCVANKDKRLSRTGILGIHARTCTDFEKIPLTKHASPAILLFQYMFQQNVERVRENLKTRICNTNQYKTEEKKQIWLREAYLLLH